MNKYNNLFRPFVIILIVICIWVIITTLILSICDIIDFEKAVTWIIIPMLCAVIWAMIPISMDKTLSNEKLKIVLERLARRWKNRCKDGNWNRIDWSNSDWYDQEYKFIFKNRWKSEKDLIKLMKKDKYWKGKYMDETKGKEIEEDYYNNWIKDHFIY